MQTAPSSLRLLTILILLLGSLFSAAANAQNTSPSSTPVAAQEYDSEDTQDKEKSAVPLLSISLGDSENPDDLVPMLRVVGILTLVTLAPAILLLMTSFSRILIVLAFMRQAMGTPTLPPNQVLIGLTLFLTYFVMSPTIDRIHETAIKPYTAHEITSEQAFESAQIPLRDFMLAQTQREELKLFFGLAKAAQPATPADTPMKILIPAFITSELKAAFQIGFLVYLPFIIIDMIVSSVLMAMGMMMLPPTVVSLPIKIILFVIVDGWRLLVGSLVQSFTL